MGTVIEAVAFDAVLVAGLGMIVVLADSINVRGPRKPPGYALSILWTAGTLVWLVNRHGFGWQAFRAGQLWSVMAGCLVPAAFVALFVGVMATDDPKAGPAKFWMVFAGILAFAAVVGVAPGLLIATPQKWLVRMPIGTGFLCGSFLAFGASVGALRWLAQKTGFGRHGRLRKTQQ